MWLISLAAVFPRFVPHCVASGELSADEELSDLTITGAELLDQHEFINHPLKSSIQKALDIDLTQELDFFAYLKVMTVFNVLGPLEPKVNLLFQLFQPDITQDRGTLIIIVY